MTSAVTQIVIIIGSISLVTFIALFGHIPSLRRTPIGYAHRLLLQHIPRWLVALDGRITNGIITHYLSRLANHLMNDKHPTVLVFYLLLVSVGLYMFVSCSWTQLSSERQWIVICVSPLPYLTLYLAASSDPGIITRQNHYYAMRHYPYNHVIFHPGSVCRTCQLYKPARSKHCSVCKACIAKHDHHCIWINNCVGHNNTRHFLAFLMATNVFLGWGTWLSRALIHAAMERMLPRGRGLTLADMTWSAYAQAAGQVFIAETYLSAVFLLSFLCGILSWAFTAYHCYLLWAGTTTNETFKWSDLREDVKDGYIYMADETSEGFQKAYHDEHDDWDHLVKPDVPWPRRQRQLLQRARPEEPEYGLPREVRWSPVKDMTVVDNIYDLGWKENFRQALWPRSL